MGLYQECPNYSPGVKFGPALGVTSFTLAYLGKILKISLYLAIRPRHTKFCMKPYLVGLYQKCPKYRPGVKFGPTPGGGGHNFYIGLYRENFRNLPVPSHKALAYQILHAASSSGPLPSVPKLMTWGQIWPTPGVTSFT